MLGYAVSFSSPWRGKRRVFERRKPALIDQPQLSTNADKLSEGFKRIRYYGVQATKTFAKVKAAIQAALAKVEGVVKGAVKIIARLTYRQRYEQSTGRD